MLKFNTLESFIINVLHKQNLLIEEQKVKDPNPLYELAQDLHYIIRYSIPVPV